MTNVSQNDISLNIYPNPCVDIIYINTDQILDNVWIYDMQGKMLIQQNNPIAKNINIQSLNQGNYLCRIKLHNGEFLQKLFTKN